jgi:hypothetical protein
VIGQRPVASTASVATLRIARAAAAAAGREGAFVEEDGIAASVSTTQGGKPRRRDSRRTRGPDRTATPRRIPRKNECAPSMR